jgi:hypothetical protein
MRTIPYLILLSAVPFGLGAQTDSEISTPQKRMEAVNLARTLLTPKPVEMSAEEIAQKDPCNPAKPVDNGVEKTAPDPGVLGDGNILAALASRITPSGTVKLGDTYILLFGQKKLKVGDVLPIVFQGATYELQLSAIERTSYTLRLNKEEITRPIKSVSVTKP